MSIPKEPRQLMINLMYLVLTAMLALNVSAEIINAFFALEKGINGSSSVVEASNNNTSKSLKEWVGKNPKEAKWNALAEKAVALSKTFEADVASLRQTIFDAAGGPHPEHPDRPLKYKDKDVTTRILVDEGKGADLEKKINATRAALLALVEPADRAAFESKIPLLVDSIAHDSKAKSWAEYKFNQMPVAAVMPTFAKITNDSKVSSAQLLNYFMDKASGKLDIKLDKFIVAIAPKKAYLISGRDKFEAEVVMGAYSSTANNIRLSGPSGALAMKDGKGTYTGGVESGQGEKTFKASASITNPATGKVETVTSEFKYEVGTGGFATVSADKMNVFYIGVPNPISIVAAGVSSNKLQVSGTGAGIALSGSGKTREVRVSAPGEATITVSAAGEMQPASFKFRVKRIPDPTACFRPQGESSGLMGSGEIKVQQAVIADLRNFDFEAKCEIQGFEFTYHKKREDPVTNQNVGTRFDSRSQQMLSRAMPGDKYYFDNIKARCPGDVAGRKINAMVWTIK